MNVLATNTKFLVNIVFENDEDATDALKKLALDQEKVFEATDEREAQKFDKPEVLLTLRMSNLSDKKVKNAAQYSRYYLYNPPKHETERRRKPRSKGHGSDYREREPVVFKRTSRSEDDDDGIDLFPDKAASIVNKKEIRDDDKDVVVVDQQESQSDNDLFSSKLLEDKRPKSASLLERIGSKSSDKIK